jgi:protease-4
MFPLKTEGKMRRNWACLSALLLFLISCACHFHLDFLGEEKIEEVVLLKSKAKEKILVIDLEGMIGTLGQTNLFNKEGDILSQVYYRLERASEDKLVRGVILRLDTPGGDVTSSDILYNEIMKFKRRTGLPVVALMMGVSASGGYYVASACDFIVAHPSTITGSIGVISIFPNVGELFSKVGIKTQVIKSGGLKDAGSPFREMSQEEQKVFQNIIDELYERFLQVVYEKRKGVLSPDELRKIADGRVYTAPQALELKLIDEVGYFDNALAKTFSLASLKEARVVAYTYYPARKTNLYAAQLIKPSLFEGKSIEDLLPILKSGFYYLWLPQMKSD